jgi:hypothetical protein
MASESSALLSFIDATCINPYPFEAILNRLRAATSDLRVTLLVSFTSKMAPDLAVE